MSRPPYLLLLLVLLTACGGDVSGARAGQATADAIAAEAAAEDDVVDAAVLVGNAAPGAPFEVGLAITLTEDATEERVAEAFRDLATQVWRSELAISSMDGLGFIEGQQDAVVTLGSAVGGEDDRFPSFADLEDALGPRP